MCPTTGEFLACNYMKEEDLEEPSRIFWPGEDPWKKDKKKKDSTRVPKIYRREEPHGGTSGHTPVVEKRDGEST